MGSLFANLAPSFCHFNVCVRKGFSHLKRPFCRCQHWAHLSFIIHLFVSFPTTAVTFAKNVANVLTSRKAQNENGRKWEFCELKSKVRKKQSPKNDLLEGKKLKTQNGERNLKHKSPRIFPEFNFAEFSQYLPNIHPEFI